MARAAHISKSKYLNGLQCPKLLWTHFNARDLIPLPGPAQQHIFDTGHVVGDLAKELYPGGVEVAMDHDNLQATVDATRALLDLEPAERLPIFEASFLEDGRYCRVDVLVPGDGEKWDLVEVKSSTRVRDVNINDVAFQADTLERAGVELGRLFVMHVNTTYVRGEEFDVGSYFHLEDVAARVARVRGYVPQAVEKMHATIVGPDPDTPIGPRCSSPYDCPLVPHCWGGLPDGNVTELYRAGRRAFAYLDEGLFKIVDMPDERLSPQQRIQAAALRAGGPHVEPEALRAWLDTLVYPLYHLDFETMNPAIPVFPGMHPYQRIPFQFSLHVQDTPGATPRHVEFLATEKGDPRAAVVAALEAVGEEGTVLAWNMGFEKGVLEDLAELYPAAEERLAGVVERMVDLIVPFRRFWYHHPDQKGSCSLKAVLPALTRRDYGDLTIADGNHAARAYVEALYGGGCPADCEEVFASLRDYCRLDTLAMVEVLAALEEAAG